MKSKFLILSIISSSLILSCNKDNKVDTIDINENKKDTVGTIKFYNRYIIAGLKDSINYTIHNDTTKSLLPDLSDGEHILTDSVDFDNDNFFDLLMTNNCGSVMIQNELEIWVKTSFVKTYLQVINNKRFAISGPFLYSDTINSKSIWTDKVETSHMYWWNPDNQYKSYRFLGLRIINKNDTIYGWARIYPKLIILDYAILKK